MNIHKNARLTPQGRALLVNGSQHRRLAGGRCAAAAAGVSERKAFRWLARHRAGGELPSRTAVRRPPDAPIEPTPRPSRQSSGCGANARPARRSLANSACRARPLARSCAGLASAGSGPPAEATDHPLSARTARRTDPSRYQEARPHRRHRPPHHRRPWRRQSQPRHRLGGAARLHQSLPRRRCSVPEDWHDGVRLVQALSFLRERLASWT